MTLNLLDKYPRLGMCRNVTCACVFLVVTYRTLFNGCNYAEGCL